MRHSAAALLLAAAAPAALAQGADGYPAKPVTVVVPLSPGGGVDIATRLITPRLTERLGQPFVVEYRVGAGTTIGTGYVASSAPDGYTLLAASANFTVAPALYRKLSWDPVRDFAPISIMNKSTTLLLVNPSLGVRSVREFVEYARSRPGEINFGTTGVGSATHLGGAWLQDATGARVTFVPFKGAGDVLTALAAGHITAGFGSTTSSLPYVKAGKLRALGVANGERGSVVPDMPTIAEQGVPGFDYVQWLGYLAPARTPGVIVSRLSAEFARIAKSPDIVERFSTFGEAPVGGTPEEFRKLIVAESARWRRVVQAAGVKLED